MTGGGFGKFGGEGENGTIADHLQNHVHLTNCIHVKNHMHTHYPVAAGKNRMQEKIALKRSQLVRGSSTCPPPFHSTSIASHLTDVRGWGRRRYSQCSQPISSLVTSNVTVEDVTGIKSGGMDHNNGGGVDGFRKSRRKVNECAGSRSCKVDCLSDSEKALTSGRDLVMIDNAVSTDVELREEMTCGKGNSGQDVCHEQSKYFPQLRRDLESALSFEGGRLVRGGETAEEVEAMSRGCCSGLNRAKRHKFRDMMGDFVSNIIRGTDANNKLSLASNSLLKHSSYDKLYMDGVEEDAVVGVLSAPRSGCGVPSDGSRIHGGGKAFVGLAEQNVLSGLSNSRPTKVKLPSARGHRMISSNHAVYDHSRFSLKSTSDELPLLIQLSGSHESAEDAASACEYSGELSIFAGHSVEDIKKDNYPCKLRISKNQCSSRQCCTGRLLSLTEQYMPKSFKDVVGQKLVVQALTNVITRGKVGQIYVFYGPHGTGKTSCARMFARALNCQSTEKPKPCRACNSCIKHDMGINQNIHEMGQVDKFATDHILDLLGGMLMSGSPSLYKVFLINDCNVLLPDSWRAILKVIDVAPRHVVFILVGSSVDNFPRRVIARCQKFYFQKLKDADIICTLNHIATNEELEFDKDALKLIASISDGSLGDAEMVLDQLSLIGQRISVPLVQELVGLVSDEEVIDLLDLALSSDTVNTVRKLREIVKSGVEPLELMTHITTVITDMLAGSYVFPEKRLQRKFFHRQILSKEIHAKLRQALKTLSESERELRISRDRLTWLTAVLVQLASDRHLTLLPRHINAKEYGCWRRIQTGTGVGKNPNGYDTSSRRIHVTQHQVLYYQFSKHILSALESVLDFLLTIANSCLSREDVRAKAQVPPVLNSAESGSPLITKNNTDNKIKSEYENHLKILAKDTGKVVRATHTACSSSGSIQMSKGECVKAEASQERMCNENVDSTVQLLQRSSENGLLGNAASCNIPSNMSSFLESRKNGEQSRSHSVIRRKVSLADIIKQARGYMLKGGWSRPKATLIGVKPEENKLTPQRRSRVLLCLKFPTIPRVKVSHTRIKPRKLSFLLKIIPCAGHICVNILR